MCLNIPKRRWFNRIRKINLFDKKVFKLVEIFPGGELVAPYRGTYYQPGVMGTVTPRIVAGDEINEGFHSATSIKALKEVQPYLYVHTHTPSNFPGPITVVAECTIPAFSKYYQFNGEVVSNRLRIDAIIQTQLMKDNLSDAAKEYLRLNYNVKTQQAG